jgi:hypothetical protein
MKKCIIFGILVALATILLYFSWNQESTASDAPLAFYGTVKYGVTVTAYQDETGRCFYGTGNEFNRYSISIPAQYTGSYSLWNGCQCPKGNWDGVHAQRVDFRVSDASPCPCLGFYR